MLDGAFVLFGGGDRGDARRWRPQGHADGDALVDAMTSYASGRDYLNFAESPVDVRRSFPERDLAAGSRASARRSTRAASCCANHPVPRLYENGLPTP